jgi:NACHT domain- and WD repeat-containing protein
MDGQRAIVGCDDTRALIFDMHSGRLIRSLPPNPGPMTALFVMDYDDYLITAGGNKITFYSFRNEDSLTNYYPKKKKPIKQMSTNRINLQVNTNPVSCFDVSRDSQLAAVATHKSLQIWQLNTPELQATLDGHTGPITCVSFAANSEFVITGSEDKSVIVWGLTLRLVANTFKTHNSAISTVIVMMDSRRIVSADREGCLYVWLADTSTILQSVNAPYKYLAVTNNMKFAVS